LASARRGRRGAGRRRRRRPAGGRRPASLGGWLWWLCLWFLVAGVAAGGSGKVSLATVNYSSGYLASLAAGLHWLANFMVRCRVGISYKDSVDKVDATLAGVVQAAWEDKQKLHLVVHGVLGLQKRLRISGALLRSTWQRIEGWRSLKGGKTRVPLTRHILEGMVLTAWGMGQGGGCEAAFEWWCGGLAWWLCFVALLRPSELLGLRCMDVIFPEGEGGEDPGVVLVIQQPKTRRIWKSQFVLIDDVRLLAWLRWWAKMVCKRGPESPFFPIRATRWRKLFGILITLLGLEKSGFTLGSLRSGGATNHFRTHRNIGHLQYLGRWHSARTLEHYLHEAYAAMTASALSDRSKQLLSDMQGFKHWLLGPPGMSACKLFRP
jgi:hypothetical protein